MKKFNLPIVAVAFTVKNWYFSKSIKHSRSQFLGTTSRVNFMNSFNGQDATQPGSVNKVASFVEFL